MIRVQRALGALLLFAAGASAQDAVDARIRLAAGDAFELRRVAAAEIKQTLPTGEAQTIRREIDARHDVEVVSVREDGAFEIKVTWARFVSSQESTASTYEFDTAQDKDSKEAVPQFLMALAGRGFTAVLSPDGSVSEVKGAAEEAAAAIETLPAMKLPAAAPAKAALLSEYSNEQIGNQLEAVFRTLPPSPVEPGATWTIEHRLGGSLPMVATNTYTLSEVGDGAIVLSLEGAIASNDAAPPVNVNGVPIRTSVAGSQKGTVELSPASGLPVKATIEGALTGESVTGGQLVIPIERTNKITVTTTPKAK
ncbi:MAG: DUF6263 family protein [Candidatus Sumerlaeia bacterium]|nr:DUF6263 family protein [Candidatus Sumerlaeia bacterium]